MQLRGKSLNEVRDLERAVAGSLKLDESRHEARQLLFNFRQVSAWGKASVFPEIFILQNTKLLHIV